MKITTHTKVLNETIEPQDFFRVISSDGKKDNCVLFESADVAKKTGERSIGSVDPTLRITGKKDDFEIIALNKRGIKLIEHFKNKFDFAENLEVLENKIKGKIKREKGEFSEEEKMKLTTLADVLRVITFEFKVDKKYEVPMGLFGVISYDFIDQFENITQNKVDLTEDDDVEMLFLDNLFIIDHLKNETTFFANEVFASKEECEEIINNYEKEFNKTKNNEVKFEKESFNEEIKIEEDTTHDEYIKMIETCKDHLFKGNNFQLVPSKTKIVTADINPFLIYLSLRELNPSPYMFFFKTDGGVLIGSSPETYLKISTENGEKIATLTPIAGTKPRGFNSEGKLDLDLDSRFENELRSDKKELSEHNMLIDLARNDIARISKPGTRYVKRPHFIVKYSHVMHLISEVVGTLKDEYDALHAYLAVMNMGTLCGTPKVKAMDVLRQIEKTKRGYYAGAIGFITPNGEMDTAMIIRSSRIKNGKIYVRSGAGIVYDSIPEREFEETENKAAANIKCIKIAMEKELNEKN
jgi:anthranilate synthase component 1